MSRTSSIVRLPYRSRRASPTARPNLEVLEDRVVPATIIDNSDLAGFATTGVWTLSTLGGFNGNRSYPTNGPGTGGSTATWTFSGLSTGLYRVSITYPAQSNRATNSPFTISLNGSTVTTVAVNQQVAPNDFSDGGFGWEDLAMNLNVGIAASQLTVKLTDNVGSYPPGNGFVIADAVRVERTGDLPAPGALTIIDNGDAGFSTVGTWTPNTNEGYQGDMHHPTYAGATPGAGVGSNAASWTLTGLTPGQQYRVSATWTAYTNRATNSPFTVFDGSNALTLVRVNQQQAPSDFTDQGVAWRDFGTFTIQSTSLKVQLSDNVGTYPSNNGYVIADAVRFERISGSPPVVNSTRIKDDGDPGFTTVGAWTHNTVDDLEAYQGDIYHTATPGGTGSRTASWAFSSLAPGQYRVSVTWTAYTNRATNSPFNVLDGTTPLTTRGPIRVNQQNAPAGFTDQGVTWQDLGVYGLSGNQLVVQLSDNVASGYVIADAVRIERVGDVLPAGFVKEVVTTGLNKPTRVAFAPDGRAFVLEKSGAIRIVKDGVLLPTPFATLTVDTGASSFSERGLVGIAFDPNFATNNYLYVFYTATSPTVHNRVSRLTANGDVAVGGSEATVLDLETVVSEFHNGGALAFGPDGKLYVAVGDNRVSANAQSLSTTFGKILRINSDGTIPADNPFYGTTSGLNRAIYAMGLRNPWGLSFQPGSGVLFINEVGESAWEEINQGAPGANYGWPYSEGARQPTDVATTEGTYKDPVYAYTHGEGLEYGRSITGGAFYNPVIGQFPSSYVGDYFFMDYSNHWIKQRDAVTGQVSVFAAAAGDFTDDLTVSPDGSLYYLSITSGTLYRIRYTG